MTKEICYNLSEITSGACNRNTPRDIKMAILNETLNMNRYEFKGFDKNGSVVRLRPKYHNHRDKMGRFTCYRSR
jgi:hypothetical protein